MKKTLIPLLALALSGAAGFHAQAQETVTSVNAVGMVMVEINRGEMHLLSVPFDLAQGEMTAEELFGMDLPYGTSIFSWNDSSQTYQSNTFRQGFFGQPDNWSAPTLKYSLGTGFFAKIPSNASQESYQIVFSGEVPGGEQYSEVQISLNSGNLYLLGFKYPVSVMVSDSSFGFDPSYGDTIFVWNPGLGYQSSTYRQGFFGQPDSWSNPNLTINPGQGFFVKTTQTKEWVATKNDFYFWP